MGTTERFPPLQSDREKQEVMFRLRRHDWITLTAFIVAGVVVGDVVYNKWARPRFEEGLRRTEADMKSNLPLRVDQNTTLVDVKYERTHSTYWYEILRLTKTARIRYGKLSRSMSEEVPKVRRTRKKLRKAEIVGPKPSVLH